MLSKEEIQERHDSRWAELLIKYDNNKFKVPFTEIMNLHEQNKADWSDHLNNSVHKAAGQNCECYRCIRCKKFACQCFEDRSQ